MLVPVPKTHVTKKKIRGFPSYGRFSPSTLKFGRGKGCIPWSVTWYILGLFVSLYCYNDSALH
ncbi:hypothetical protein BT96DRAFT_366600 [Gymnopus androsaceus JB14]|uniref:Uncharacterized protein n=1 Tax=Gymnopus androsaceus JB14 TaxID=1447944 RepID=A0A6A4IN52_9AGAR|nr:hypothetical protein BT96DRAFT_366600 [Gymnopus androsaceus JB14]